MKNISLLLLSTLGVISVLFMPAIPQDLLYHQFAGQQLLFGIPNFFNVLSNLPFLIAGFLGYRLIVSNKKIALVISLKVVYKLFFLSVILVGLGSCYYHLSPSNTTIIWDRLPMVLAFMSFFTIVLAEFIDEKLAARFFLPLLISGIVSVLYWYWSELGGQGDLRMYILVQFLPVILMPVIFLLYSPRFSKSYIFWLILACYGFAKGLELMDVTIFELTELVSGHPLKHLLSAAGPFLFYLGLKKRYKL